MKKENNFITRLKKARNKRVSAGPSETDIDRAYKALEKIDIVKMAEAMGVAKDFLKEHKKSAKKTKNKKKPKQLENK